MRVQNNFDFDVIERFLPPFIDLVLEYEFNAVLPALYLLVVNEDERDLVLIECLLQNYVVNDALALALFG